MSFMSNEELQAHEQLHRSNRYFCQKYCGKFYETIDECEQHEYGQHEYDMYKCNVSNKGEDNCLFVLEECLHFKIKCEEMF